jgi:hypothetical protein
LESSQNKTEKYGFEDDLQNVYLYTADVDRLAGRVFEIKLEFRERLSFHVPLGRRTDKWCSASNAFPAIKCGHKIAIFNCSSKK